MKCPHCSIQIHAYWTARHFLQTNNLPLPNNEEAISSRSWAYRHMTCPNCIRHIIHITSEAEIHHANGNYSWRLVYPQGANRGPVPPEVPNTIAADYIEACGVLPTSAKASAALARRCLQHILHDHGYIDRDLAKEIQKLLDEQDPQKALPRKLRETIDAIRNFGNFSAHPLDDKTTLSIIDVEDHEAEWCLEIAEGLFEHFYVGPAEVARKRAELDAKLAAAGKPPVR